MNKKILAKSGIFDENICGYMWVQRVNMKETSPLFSLI